jgi:hypothetical protein
MILESSVGRVIVLYNECSCGGEMEKAGWIDEEGRMEGRPGQSGSETRLTKHMTHAAGN